jgi:hypothetical protein
MELAGVAMRSGDHRADDTRHLVAAGCEGTRWCSLRRGSNDWLGSGKPESNIRAIAAAESKDTVNGMKTIVQIANAARETMPLKEVIPFWFALSSPLLGVLLGLMGAWFVTWLSA